MLYFPAETVRKFNERQAVFSKKEVILIACVQIGLAILCLFGVIKFVGHQIKNCDHQGQVPFIGEAFELRERNYLRRPNWVVVKSYPVAGDIHQVVLKSDHHTLYAVGGQSYQPGEKLRVVSSISRSGPDGIVHHKMVVISTNTSTTSPIHD